jgi:hypothetical protein
MMTPTIGLALDESARLPTIRPGDAEAVAE